MIQTFNKNREAYSELYRILFMIMCLSNQLKKEDSITDQTVNNEDKYEQIQTDIKESNQVEQYEPEPEPIQQQQQQLIEPEPEPQQSFEPEIKEIELKPIEENNIANIQSQIDISDQLNQEELDYNEVIDEEEEEEDEDEADEKDENK